MKLTEFDYPQIYCDMDGVLVDLIAGATKILGYDLVNAMDMFLVDTSYGIN